MALYTVSYSYTASGYWGTGLSSGDQHLMTQVIGCGRTEHDNDGAGTVAPGYFSTSATGTMSRADIYFHGPTSGSFSFSSSYFYNSGTSILTRNNGYWGPSSTGPRYYLSSGTRVGTVTQHGRSDLSITWSCSLSGGFSSVFNVSGVNLSLKNNNSILFSQGTSTSSRMSVYTHNQNAPLMLPSTVYTLVVFNGVLGSTALSKLSNLTVDQLSKLSNLITELDNSVYTIEDYSPYMLGIDHMKEALQATDETYLKYKNKIVTKLSSVSQILKDKVKNLTDRITTANTEGEANSRAISSIISDMRS